MIASLPLTQLRAATSANVRRRTRLGCGMYALLYHTSPLRACALCRRLSRRLRTCYAVLASRGAVAQGQSRGLLSLVSWVRIPPASPPPRRLTRYYPVPHPPESL